MTRAWIPPADVPPPAGLRAAVALFAVSSLCASTTAHAAWPQDVTLSQLDSYQGESYTNDDGIRAAWVEVARDLGVAITGKPQGATTLGLNGFELGVNNSVTVVRAHRFDGDPTSWERAREGNQDGGPLWVPGLHLRKGLPFSLEAGGRIGWLAMTRQAVVGGYGRFAPLESFDKAPEIAIQVGYDGYVGNEELDLGASSATLVVGKTVPFPSGRRSNTATIQPFLAGGFTWIKANPRLDAERLEDLGIGALASNKKEDLTYDPDMRQIVLSAGMRLTTGDVALRFGLSLPTAAAPGLDATLGTAF